MSTCVHIKQGGTLLLNCVLTQDDGTPVDLTSSVLASEARDTLGDVVCALTVVVSDAPNGIFTLTATSAQTAAFLPGRMAVDIAFVQSGLVIYSDTFSVIVHAAVTTAPAS